MLSGLGGAVSFLVLLSQSWVNIGGIENVYNYCSNMHNLCIFPASNQVYIAKLFSKTKNVLLALLEYVLCNVFI